MKDLVAFYQTRQVAEQVRDGLISAGFDRDDVTLYDRSGKDEASLWEDIKNAFGFGDDDDQTLYAEAARRGAVAVGLSFDNDEDEPSHQRAIQIMQRYNPIDLKAQAAQWRQQGWKGEQRPATAAPATSRTAATAGSAGQAGTVVPVTEEQVQIGKRAVESGGVRIHTRVTQKPVEKQVELRKERVDVQRRPVDRPLTDADKAAFQERTIEVAERSEQPVVNKQARVVEEVVVNKDVQQRTETVRETARRTDVEVEKLNPDQSRGSTHVAPETFAAELARDDRYRGRDWATCEPEFRRTFEQRYPGSKWEQFKDAIHRGYEKVRQKV